MKNILVTVDFEEQVELLMDKAFELAQAFDSKIWLMHVAAPDPDFVSYSVGPQYIRDFRAEDLKKEHRQLQAYVNDLQKKGVEAEGLLIQGATTELIINESTKLDVDLIMTGHHDRSFFYNALFGSVSAQIIKKSKIPVLIVPFE